MYHYLNILPATGQTKLTDEFTSKLLTVDSIIYLQNAAVVARIKSNLPVDKQLLTDQLDSLDMRYDVLQALSEMKKLETIPLKYRTHKEFARLLLYSYITGDYDPPLSMDYLGSVTEGKNNFHVFSLSYVEEGVKKQYLGIGGGTPEIPGKLDFDNTFGYSQFELVETDWAAQAKKLIREFKEN